MANDETVTTNPTGFETTTTPVENPTETTVDNVDGFPVTKPEIDPNEPTDGEYTDDTALTNSTDQPMPSPEMLAETDRLNKVNQNTPVTETPMDLDHVVTTTTSTLGQVYNDLADRLQSWLDKGSTPGGGSMIGAEIAVMNELIAHLRHGTIPMV